jgi:hypothetical protein
VIGCWFFIGRKILSHLPFSVAIFLAVDVNGDADLKEKVAST